MPEFCMFTTTDGKQVAVNPDLVRCVVESGSDRQGDTTRIEFGGDHHITVRVSVIDVISGLRTGQE